MTKYGQDKAKQESRAVAREPRDAAAVVFTRATLC